MKSGTLNLLEPSGSVQACNGIAFCFYVLPDDDSQRVETCWTYYVLSLKYKFTLSYLRLIAYYEIV